MVLLVGARQREPARGQCGNKIAASFRLMERTGYNHAPGPATSVPSQSANGSEIPRSSRQTDIAPVASDRPQRGCRPGPRQAGASLTALGTPLNPLGGDFSPPVPQGSGGRGEVPSEGI